MEQKRNKGYQIALCSCYKLSKKLSSVNIIIYIDIIRPTDHFITSFIRIKYNKQIIPKKNVCICLKKKKLCEERSKYGTKINLNKDKEKKKNNIVKNI